MKNLAFFIYILFAIDKVEAGDGQSNTPCKKDACFKAVAYSKWRGPNLASRIQECSVIVGTIIENDFTRWRHETMTPPPTTTTITDPKVTQTITIIPGTPVVERRHPETTPPAVLSDRWEVDEGILQRRDKYIIQSTVPSWANACAKPYDYAIACLCFGVQARKKLRPAGTKWLTDTVMAEQATVTVLVGLPTRESTFVTIVSWEQMGE